METGDGSSGKEQRPGQAWGPGKRQAFANISLTRNTVADRISDLSEDLDSQLKRKVKSFIAFSVAIDESTDITDVAQLAIFIRGVDDTLTVTEEFVELVPMTDTTTAADIFTALVRTLDRVGVDWSRAVSLATDGAPSMTGEKAGVVTKFREKVQTSNGGLEFWTFHCILHQEALCCKSLKMDNVMEVVVRTVNFIRSRGLNHRQFDSPLREKDHNYGLPYHTEVRWLSRGAVLRRFFDLREEIKQFVEKKGKPVLEFQSTEWMQDLAFMVDVTEHLNNLNKMLQGRTKVVTQYYDSICAFKLKLSLWETQLAGGDAAHFPCLKDVFTTQRAADMKRFKDKITRLVQEFEQRFQIFGELEKDFKDFCSPFMLLAKAEHYAWVAYWDHSSATLLPAKLIPISSRLFGFQFPSSHQKIYCLPILTETSLNDLATMDPADTASDPTLLHKAISSQASPSQNPAPEPAPPLSPLRDFYTTIPELFSGELDECRRFLLQCDMVFQQWPLTLDSDRSKILTETSQNDLATMDPADTASDPTLLHKAISSQGALLG
ncbi:general transcription factor II-I repeat domain-containing protein 2B-like [Seriola lalandi dorsalis]|uniref:general transcription factor II-I repeat domain-containing protein 2B-like n=1 Tax=Seriola lalandi dorsalis TaxID=1841481 RepID=UPI000C6FC58C|nr:general transcription factor II-I repeat domain-containing protein 2B-like [Seriola lalandi dorsalis]